MKDIQFIELEWFEGISPKTVDWFFMNGIVLEQKRCTKVSLIMNQTISVNRFFYFKNLLGKDWNNVKNPYYGLSFVIVSIV